jgi:D-glycero-beta-D-manno-heptose-7-phosphate kinase
MANIIIFGEAMLDIHTFGNIERINPEAPVPVLHVIKNKEKLGLGGAANVANNLVSLKSDVVFVSVVNEDHSGLQIKSLCKDNNIKFNFFSDGRPTIVKQRFVAAEYNQQVLRVDYEDKSSLSKEYSDKIINFILDESPSIILISDYAKGLITEYFMEELKNKFKGKIIVDPKPQNINFYKDVFLLKPNVIEAQKILGYEINDDNIPSAIKELSTKFNSNIVITLGKKGVIAFDKDKKEIFQFDSYAKEVFDVSGCGDTFIATLTYALDKGQSLKEAVDLANKAAGIVITHFGAVPIKYEELLKQ